MKVLKISSCAQCPYCTKYKAKKNSQKEIIVCEKSMKFLPKKIIFGVEVIVDDGIPE